MDHGDELGYTLWFISVEQMDWIYAKTQILSLDSHVNTGVEKPVMLITTFVLHLYQNDQLERQIA